MGSQLMQLVVASIIVVLVEAGMVRVNGSEDLPFGFKINETAEVENVAPQKTAVSKMIIFFIRFIMDNRLGFSLL